MSVCILGSYAKALVMTVDRIPQMGETLIGYDFRQTFGGKGSDMAVQAARLGARVTYAGVVGDDAFGQEFIALMQAEGVDIQGLRITREQATGAGFIIKDQQAQNIIVVDMGANSLFQESDVDQAAALLQAASVVLAQLEIPLNTALYGLQQAKRLGKTTILNPAPAVDLRGCDLRYVDILTPNETEARIAAGLAPESSASHEEAAAILLKTGCQCIVMTLGANGAAVFTKDRNFQIPSFAVKEVDSNGAGDSFNAALAVALSAGKPIEAAVRYANAVAALCCTKWETVPSYHTKEQVEDFLQQQKTTAAES
jgi:ribokinase